MKIRTKVILIFMLLSLPPLAIIGTIAYKNGESVIRKSLGLAFQQIAYETIDRVDRILHDAYHNVRAWADLELMQEVVTGDLDGKITSFLISIGREYAYFDSINILDLQGKIVASSIPRSIDRTISKSYSYENAVNGTKYIEDVHVDEISKRWVVTFSFPIKAKFEKDKIIGVLCANWRADELNAVTQIYKKEKRRTGYEHIVLIRKDGLIISAPDFEKKDIFSHDLTKTGLGSILLGKQKTDGYVVSIGEHNIKSLIGYSYSKGHGDFPGLGWITLVEQDVRRVFAPVQKFRIILLSVGLMVFLLVIISSLILTQKITEPILKISQLSVRVAQGDFEGRISRLSNDEIGILSESFNKMIVELQKSTENLNKEIAERKLAEEQLKVAYEQLKETQSQLIQSEKMGAVGQLAAGAAHEINNPLFVISGEAEILLKDEHKDQDTKDTLQIILEQVKRIEGITKSLLEFSRQKVFKPEPLDVNKVIEGAISLLRFDKDLERIGIVNELAEGLPNVWGDKNQLIEVFLNIMLNAVQAMGEGGILTVRTNSERIIESGEIRPGKFKTGERIVTIEIKDTGKGMDDWTLKKIFTPFFTTKEKGVGLGLSVCYGIIENHGGVIEVQSKLGEGTSFLVKLPVPKKEEGE